MSNSAAAFEPKFDAAGLLTAVVLHHETRAPLMVAYMNEEALQATISSSIAHFYSRSRKALWKKGETSGNFLHVQDILVDCDQDALVILARPEGPACHTGAESCFFRRLENGALLTA